MANSLPKIRIKAPFRLTVVGRKPHSLWMWLWSRRGKQWIIDQELRLGPGPVKQHLNANESRNLR